MPHQALKLIAGVDQNKTPTLNEAAISYSNLIRFVPDRNNIGLVQKLGGWTQFFTNPIGSVVRTLLAWEDINANAWLGVGAEASLNVIVDGGLKNITPQTTTANVAVSFTTTTGSTGNIVTIDATGSNLDQYDVVNIQTQVSVGGLVLFGAYPTTPVSANQFRILATNIFGEPQYATSAVTTGGSVPSFAFASGSPAVTVTLADHGYVAGSTFPVLVPLSAGSVTVFGNYVVSSVTSTSVFVINASSSASTTPTRSASGTGTTATLTYSTSYTIPVGSTIVVAGVTPAGYNGTFTVTASSSGSVSYANATTGAQTVAGTIIVTVAKENGGNARFIYYNGIGALSANSGYGVGGYGTGGFGSGSPPSANTGTPITTTGARPSFRVHLTGQFMSGPRRQTIPSRQLSPLRPSSIRASSSPCPNVRPSRGARRSTALRIPSSSAGLTSITTRRGLPRSRTKRAPTAFPRDHALCRASRVPSRAYCGLTSASGPCNTSGSPTFINSTSLARAAA